MILIPLWWLLVLFAPRWLAILVSIPITAVFVVWWYLEKDNENF